MQCLTLMRRVVFIFQLRLWIGFILVSRLHWRNQLSFNVFVLVFAEATFWAPFRRLSAVQFVTFYRAVSHSQKLNGLDVICQRLNVTRLYSIDQIAWSKWSTLFVAVHSRIRFSSHHCYKKGPRTNLKSRTFSKTYRWLHQYQRISLHWSPSFFGYCVHSAGPALLTQQVYTKLIKCCLGDVERRT